VASVEILGIPQFAAFLTDIVKWFPNLIAAIAIFIVAAISANFLEKIAKASVKKLEKASVKKLEIENVKLVGATVRWAIYIFAVSAILLQLGIAPTIINSFVIGLIAMFTLAFGLAFGLGGKEEAARVIREIRKTVSEKWSDSD